MRKNGENEIIRDARELLSGRFQGILATHSIECEGYPLGSLLPYSIDRDGWPLILISHLAKHTRNLSREHRCSLTVAEQDLGDIQTTTRLSCLADAVQVGDIDFREADRHFRYFPASHEYYRELNFHFYRLKPVRFYCVAGFGAARWVGIDRMEAKNPYTYDQEEALLADINRQFGNRLKQHLALQNDSGPIAVGVDATGLDLRQKARLLRLTLPTPAHTPEELQARLTDLL